MRFGPKNFEEEMKKTGGDIDKFSDYMADRNLAMNADFHHEPVMIKEVIASLLVGKTGIYVDGTVGGAGHAYEILRQTDAFLVGIDCDSEALQAAEKKLAQFGSRKILVKANFVDLGSVGKFEHRKG